MGRDTIGVDVELRAIDRDNWRDLLAVRVRPDQLRFVADHQPVVLVVLAKAYVRPGDRRWTPLAIYDGSQPIGVAALADDGGSCELFHLVIDHDLQGRGHGASALGLLIGHARDRLRVRRLELTVHPQNHAAERLYRGAGFVPTGETRHGEPVWLLELG